MEEGQRSLRREPMNPKPSTGDRGIPAFATTTKDRPPTPKPTPPRDPREKPVRKSRTKLRIAGAVGGALALLGGGITGCAFAAGAFDQHNSAVHEQVPSGFIESEKPEQIHIELSIVIENADGSDNQISIKKRPDHIEGGVRTTNFRIDPQTQEPISEGQIRVNSALIFKRGLKGKTVSLIIKDAKKVTIKNTSTEDTKNPKRGGFHVDIETISGDTSTLIIGTTAIELAQDLPPARNVDLGNGDWKLVTTPVPIESKDGITIVPLGKITTSSNVGFPDGTSAQIYIRSVSTVTGKNGIEQ